MSQDEIKEMTKNDRPSTEKLARKVRMFLSRRPLREILHLKPQHSAAVILVVLAVFWGALEIRSRITHVYEYDARISGNLITISSRVPGWITKIPVLEGETIKVGDTLVVLDREESKLLVQQLEAEVNATAASIKRLHARRDLVAKQSESQYQTAVSSLKGAK